MRKKRSFHVFIISTVETSFFYRIQAQVKVGAVGGAGCVCSKRSLEPACIHTPPLPQPPLSPSLMLPQRNKGVNTTATIVINLIKILIEGPEVSLNGSPTVSPTTAALCASLPLPP